MATIVQLHPTSVTNNNDNHREIFSRIWIDAYNNYQKSQDIQEKLYASLNRIKNVYDDEKQLSENDRLVLMLSGQLDQKLIPSIHQLQNVSTTFIDSEDKSSEEKWTCEFSKLKGVNTELDHLISQINEDHRNRWELEGPLSINTFTTTGETGQSTTGINGQFVFFQVLIDCLLRLKSNEMDKTELICYFEKEYNDNQIELTRLHEFENNYSRDKVLWWYTRQSFFYKTLNAALRKQDIHMIFLYRSYISDMYRQLQHNQSKSSVRVYRSQLMTSTELDNLQHNIDQFISINSFFSASSDPQVAEMYMAGKIDQINLERVLFEIEANPNVIRRKPFADISQYSHFPDESEVLFMIGSIFRLNNIDYDNNRQIWIIRMSLCGDDEHSLTPVLKRMQKENGTRTTSLCTLGKLLWNMGKFDLAKKYYNRCVNELPENEPLLRTVYENLAIIASQEHDYEESVRWHQKLEDLKEGRTSIRVHRIIDRYNPYNEEQSKRLLLFVLGWLFISVLVIGGGIYSLTISKGANDSGKILWQRDSWAYACDFPGNDLVNVTIASQLCGPKCSQTKACTHFIWTRHNGGTCWMKTGPVSKNDAIFTNDQNMVCGVRYANSQGSNISTIHWHKDNWAFACDFHENDFNNVNIVRELCRSKCVQTENCTHFTWTQHNGGTCWMKTGNVSKNDAFFTDDQTTICGIAESA